MPYFYAMRQITDHIIMVRPRHFGFNAETATNNTFQHEDGSMTGAQMAAEAQKEFDALVHLLEMHGVHVDVIEDTESPVKPDAVFPNNWFSTHEDGAVITYPMLSSVRRAERREDVVDYLAKHYALEKRYAFEVFEEQGMFLEGTGSLVLDRQHRIAYACLSPRTDLALVERFCVLRGYEPCVFHAFYDDVAVYHTNVVMALGTHYVVICMDAIPNAEEQAKLLASFERTQKEVIPVTLEQMGAFAGNMIELQSQFGGSLCVMSEQAYRSLNPQQITAIEQHSKILYAPVYTIEKYGGGSARCMIAENFLKRYSEVAR